MLNFTLELTDRDGGTLDTLEYDTLDELLAEYPHAEMWPGDPSNWSAWVGDGD